MSFVLFFCVCVFSFFLFGCGQNTQISEQRRPHWDCPVYQLNTGGVWTGETYMHIDQDANSIVLVRIDTNSGQTFSLTGETKTGSGRGRTGYSEDGKTLLFSGDNFLPVSLLLVDTAIDRLVLDMYKILGKQGQSGQQTQTGYNTQTGVRSWTDGGRDCIGTGDVAKLGVACVAVGGRSQRNILIIPRQGTRVASGTRADRYIPYVAGKRDCESGITAAGRARVPTTSIDIPFSFSWNAKK